MQVDNFWQLLIQSLSLDIDNKYDVGKQISELSKSKVTELTDVFEYEKRELGRLFGNSAKELQVRHANGENILGDASKEESFWREQLAIEPSHEHAWHNLGLALYRPMGQSGGRLPAATGR